MSGRSLWYKLIVMTLALVLIVPILAACDGTEEATPSPIPLTTPTLAVSTPTPTPTPTPTKTPTLTPTPILTMEPTPKQVSVEVSYDEFQKASESNNGHVSKTIEVASGDSIVVTLWSNATTGFSWSESATISDPGVLQQTNHDYVAPEAQGLVGAAGKEVWTFKALKVDTSQVSMGYSQPWEGGQKDVYGFSLTVTVK